MTYEEFISSVENDEAPPAALSDELKVLWFSKNDQWEAAHNIAQDMPSSMGSLLHAHLHLVEGDIGNAGYWYSRAGRPARSSRAEIPQEWEELVRENL